jgi:putative ABC transport system permease protein
MRRLPFDYAVRNLGRSRLRLAATIAGSALVVMLILAAAAFVEGMGRTLAASPSNRNVLLLGAGSEESIERSEIGAAVPSMLRASVPGIREELGVSFVSPEVLMALVVHQGRDTEPELRAVVRGVTSAALLVHSQVEITEGRAPRAGRNELMAGRLAHEMLGVTRESIAPGETLWLDDEPWEIVGSFRAPGTVMESEVWSPLADVMVATNRDSISAVVVTPDEAEFSDFDAWATTRLDLEIVAMRESEYYASLRRFYRPVQAMVWTTAALMALAGLLGGINTLYAAFVSRSREVGMLRSLGFSRSAILLSLIQESLLAASAGALLACALAQFLLDGVAVRFSMGAFQLSLSAPSLLLGLGAGVLVGLLGAIPPALQCLRLPIPAALKGT